MHGDSGNTGLQRATAGNSATNRSDSGDSGNPGLQRATAGNSATTGRGWWRFWQHWATTGNCWQLSNNWEGMVETLATLGYNGQLLATQQQLRGDGGDSGNTGLQRATTGNFRQPYATTIIYLMIFMLYDSYMKV